MLLSRLILPLLFAFAMLLSQQVSMTHALGHTLAEHQQQQDKQSPHNHNCEQCALDAQLGSALHSAAISFTSPLFSADTWLRSNTAFHPAHVLPATARGPPASLHLFA